MEQPEAVVYLRRVCAFPGDQTNARLEHEWLQAKGRIGTPMGKMGLPSLLDVPSSMKSYIDELKNQPWMEHRLRGTLAGAEFKMVEIEPLLAMQFAIDIERSEHICGVYSSTKREEDLLSLCLPMSPPSPQIDVYQDQKKSGSMLLVTKDLSLGIVRDGTHEIKTENGPKLIVGVELVAPLPLLHVVCFENRYYLHNGFHRAYSASLAGATHVPCIVRTVSHAGDIGIGQDTFSISCLGGANPPTVGHFTKNRAHPVPLKSLTRVIQVSWAEYTV